MYIVRALYKIDTFTLLWRLQDLGSRNKQILSTESSCHMYEYVWVNWHTQENALQSQCQSQRTQQVCLELPSKQILCNISTYCRFSDFINNRFTIIHLALLNIPDFLEIYCINTSIKHSLFFQAFNILFQYNLKIKHHKSEQHSLNWHLTYVTSPGKYTTSPRLDHSLTG